MDRNTPTVNNTLGAIFLGVMAASTLFGVTSLQAYLYYHHYPRDSKLHKVAVGVLWSLDAFHQALTLHAAYIYVVSRTETFNIIWSVKLQVAVNVAIIVLVQSLYAYRVWKLSGYYHGFLGYIVALVVAGGLGLGIAFAYQIYTVDTYPELNRVSWAIQAALASATAIDFFISGAMCYYLWISQSSVSRLNSKISTVMQYSLSSGLLTSACSLSTLFTYILLPDTFIYLGLEFILTKLYVGSFFAMLNARQRKDGSTASSTNVSGSGGIQVHIREGRYGSSDSELESGRNGIQLSPSSAKRPNYATGW